MVPARRPNRAGEQRRARILKETEQLVLDHGHPAVTMQMVAEAAGVTQPAIHYHFPTRDELFVELLRERDANAPEALLNDAVEALIAGVEASETTPALVALFADYASKARDADHPAHRYFADRYQQMSMALAQSIRGRRESGRANPHIDDETVALLLLAVSDGLQTRWLVDPKISMGTAIRAAVDAALDPSGP